MRLLLISLLSLSLGLAACSPDNKTTRPTPGTPGPVNKPIDGGDIQPTGPRIIEGTRTDATVGDWDSSGAPVFDPTIPAEIDFSYTCNAFVKDGVNREAAICSDCEEREYILYRLYEFTVDQDNSSINLKDLEFRKIAYFSDWNGGERVTLEVQEDIAAEMVAANFSFSIFPDWSSVDPDSEEEPEEFKVRLYTSVGQVFGSASVFARGEIIQDFESSFIGGETRLDVRNADGSYEGDQPELNVEFSCRKID